MRTLSILGLSLAALVATTPSSASFAGSPGRLAYFYAAELWSLDAYAVEPTRWNDDWDGSPLVLKDWLFEGGENSQIHAVKLNRGTGADGLVTVAPELVWHAPGWDDQELQDYGNEVSIESSVAVSGNTLYFANSGGLVQGWDIGPLLSGIGEPQRVFRFWTGDDTDGSIVVDEAGMLYGGSEWERHNAQGATVGQMWKLNPAASPHAPVGRSWSIAPGACAQSSTTSHPCFLASARTCGMSAGWPYRWTGMIALIDARSSEGSAFSRAATSMVYVAREMSANRGVAPTCSIAATVATPVYETVMTESPGPTPPARSAMISASVPLAKQTAYPPPWEAANSRSNCRTSSLST